MFGQPTPPPPCAACPGIRLERQKIGRSTANLPTYAGIRDKRRGKRADVAAARRSTVGAVQAADDTPGEASYARRGPFEVARAYTV